VEQEKQLGHSEIGFESQSIALGARETWSRRRSVQWIVATTAALAVLLAIAAPYLGTGGTKLWTLFVPVSLVSIAILVMLRVGRVAPAVRVGTFAIWLTITLSLINLGGMSSRASDGYVVLVVAAAIIWSVRAATVFATMSIAAMIAIQLADATGLTRVAPFSVSPLQMAMTTSAIILVVLVCMIVQQRDLRSKERMARTNEARIVSLVQNSPDALVFMDDHGIVQFMNHASETLSGYSLSECFGMRFSDLPMFPLAAREHVWKAFKALVEGQMDPGPRRTVIIHKKGHPVPVEVNSHRVQLSDGTLGVEYTIRDFSERVLAEQAAAKLDGQLREAQKMETIGRLAGGVAHDFNNLLTVIMGQSELLLLQDLTTQPRNQVAQILKAADRARLLTQQLLAYARRQVVTPRRMSANAAIVDLQSLLESLAGRKVKIDVSLDDTCGQIRIDPSQLDQVLTNLVANARDSMPDGGTITICTKSLGGPGAIDEKVEIIVHDNGVGISDDVKAKMFEPFYTTKGPGQGTGLGLAVVEGIVSQNGGTVTVESKFGIGTTFRLMFPVSNLNTSSGDRQALPEA
jgi:two-component system, cell cycle sensor histidine kinase and response regulator CckA